MGVLQLVSLFLWTELVWWMRFLLLWKRNKKKQRNKQFPKFSTTFRSLQDIKMSVLVSLDLNSWGMAAALKSWNNPTVECHQIVGHSSQREQSRFFQPFSIWEGPASQPQSTLSQCKNLPPLLKNSDPPKLGPKNRVDHSFQNCLDTWCQNCMVLSSGGCLCPETA